VDSLVTSFVAAFAAEWGDKTQLIVALLAARSGRQATVLLGLGAAAILSTGLAAFAAALVTPTITPQAMSLLLALALLFAGATGLFRPGDPSIGSEKTPLLVAAFILCLAAETGDRTQFLTFGLAGRFGAPPLAAAGAAVGIIAAAVPAAWLGQRLAKDLPLSAIRRGIAILFLMIGFIAAVGALRLS